MLKHPFNLYGPHYSGSVVRFSNDKLSNTTHSAAGSLPARAPWIPSAHPLVVAEESTLEFRSVNKRRQMVGSTLREMCLKAEEAMEALWNP